MRRFHRRVISEPKERLNLKKYSLKPKLFMKMLSNKQQDEQNAFKRFVGHLGSQQKWLNISSRPEPEPDLLCIHVADGLIAFELVSLVDEKIAKIQAAGEKACQEFFYTTDPSERIVRNKLGCKYTTKAGHIELLIYTTGQIITTDNVIIPTIRPLFDEVSHPFSRVWFMGDAVFCLWPVGKR